MNQYNIMHEHDNPRDAWPPLPGAFCECKMHRYVAIIEGLNHSLKRISRDYKRSCYSRKERGHRQEAEEKTPTYQRRNILIYYCVFMIPIIIPKNLLALCSGSPAPLTDNIIWKYKRYEQMTLTFENDNNVIVYTMEKIIAFAKNNQYIFLAQSVWWIASVLGLQTGLVIYIDNLQVRSDPVSQPEIGPDIAQTGTHKDDSERQDKVLRECEEFLWNSRRLRNLVTLKASGRTKTGRINPLASTKQALRVTKMTDHKRHDLTEGIKEEEIQRRKANGECLRCAWPSDQKSSHRERDCIWKIKISPGTATGFKALRIKSSSLESSGSI